MAKSRNMQQRAESRIANFYEWRKIRNMGMGSCGIFSVIQAVLVMLFRMHPRDAEKIFSSENAQALQHLVQLCRETIVRAAMEGDDDLIFTVGRVVDPAALAGGGEATDGHAGGATDLAELHTPEAWTVAVL